ncbi:hypothetical protein BDQ17DRAFT_1332941 [Cyathus striatus]|nr:hypothetical protein BDQ17DRAFT_1332941 [Cyathus striatus]
MQRRNRELWSMPMGSHKKDPVRDIFHNEFNTDLLHEHLEVGDDIVKSPNFSVTEVTSGKTTTKYGDVTIYDQIELAFKAPLYLSVTYGSSTDFAALAILRAYKILQLEACCSELLGRTWRVDTNCKAWSKQSGVPLQFEGLEDDGKLIWMGSKEEADHIISHYPAGGYVLFVTGDSLSYLEYLQNELKKKGKRVTVAWYYTLFMYPAKTFPVALRQVVLAMQRVMQAGFPPNKISILGESAGGHLVSVPRPELAMPLRSAYMMSPWIRLVDKNNNMAINDATDFVSSMTLNYWGKLILKDVPSVDERPYADPNDAPKNWWNNAETVADRVLLAAGGVECLMEERTVFSNELKKNITMVSPLFYNQTQITPTHWWNL